MSDEYKMADRVDVGGGAQVCFPTEDLCYTMRYGATPNFNAAAALESYRHLVLECTQKETLRRIKQIREHCKA